MAKRKKVGDRQSSIVMKTFNRGRLRTPQGKTVTNPEQARAIAMSEKRAASSRGVSRRTFKGRTRIRPKLKKR